MRTVICHQRLMISMIAVGISAVLFSAGAVIHMAGQVENAGPYVPTPQVVVDHMLKMANVGPDDFVIDLGSGDGRIVLTAAKQYKARGIGVDIDKKLVEQSNKQAKVDGVADRVQFYERDIFVTDTSKATVLTLYLLPEPMVKLRPKLLAELRPGTRIVSHDYYFDEWSPDQQIELDVPEKKSVTGVPKAHVYLWVVPARVAGMWQVDIPGIRGGMRLQLTLNQRYQAIEGIATGAGRFNRLHNATLHGDEIKFSVPGDGRGGGPDEFRGRVSGDRMEGTVLLAGGRSRVRWRASRLASQ